MSDRALGSAREPCLDVVDHWRYRQRMGAKPEDDGEEPLVIELDLDQFDGLDDEATAELALADGSDVHDVGALDRELQRERPASSLHAAVEQLIARSKPAEPPTRECELQNPAASELPVIRTDDRVGLRRSDPAAETLRTGVTAMVRDGEAAARRRESRPPSPDDVAVSLDPGLLRIWMRCCCPTCATWTHWRSGEIGRRRVRSARPTRRSRSPACRAAGAESGERPRCRRRLRCGWLWWSLGRDGG